MFPPVLFRHPVKVSESCYRISKLARLNAGIPGSLWSIYIMRSLLLIFDSFGIGALPDAASYGDEGANTAAHICASVNSVNWPHLTALGLGNCAPLTGSTLEGVEVREKPEASWGVMMEKSPGKDTISGHWEIAGIPIEQPFHTFPSQFPSFPDAIINAFCQEFSTRLLGNKAASGIQIIKELGPRHLETGWPIIYTSSDSVIQLAAHESIIPLKKLYEMCRFLRELADPLCVGRVIARPFTGSPGHFVRTAGRHDYSFNLPAPSILDHLQSAGVETIAVGKIVDIFNGSGMDQKYPEKGNSACLKRLLKVMDARPQVDSFVFVNFVDTDMIYGHRRDVQGYHDAIAVLDAGLPELMERMENGDILIISADHGCDPTFRGTDHTREYVPLLVYRKGYFAMPLGTRTTFADVSQTLAELHHCASMKLGASFAGDLQRPQGV